MKPGKLASQAAHAGRLSLLHFIRDNPHRLDELIEKNSDGTVIVLKAKNQAALETSYRAAQDAGLPSALFTDSGHVMLPHFDGGPVVTAMAIGPARREQMRSITKKFRSVR